MECGGSEGAGAGTPAEVPEWEARLDPQTNCLFFLDHRRQTTSWLPPQAQPSTSALGVPAEVGRELSEPLGPPPPPVDNETTLQRSMIAMYLAKAREGRRPGPGSREMRPTAKASLHSSEGAPSSRLHDSTNSLSSSIVERLDPDQLRAEIDMARRRVEELKRSENQLDLAELPHSTAASGPPQTPAQPSGSVERLQSSPPRKLSEPSHWKAELIYTRRVLKAMAEGKALAEAELDLVQLAGDRTHLELLQEKEALLRELTSINVKEAAPDVEAAVTEKVRALEADLKAQLGTPRPGMEHRLQLHNRITQMNREMREYGERSRELERLLESAVGPGGWSSESELSGRSSEASLHLGSRDLGELSEVRGRVEALVGQKRVERSESSTTATSRSAVSAAVSDESVAGDSGVYEAGTRQSPGAQADQPPTNSPQLSLSVYYQPNDLCVSFHHCRSLELLAGFSPSALLSVQGLLLPILPTDTSSELATPWVSPSSGHPHFKQDLSIPIHLSVLRSKVLQLYLWAESGNVREVLGTAQLNFATLEVGLIKSFWLNLLGVEHQPSGSYPAAYLVRQVSPRQALPAAGGGGSGGTKKTWQYRKRSKDHGRRGGSGAEGGSRESLSGYLREGGSGTAQRREGSSDDSTIVSSQTSTLTRSAVPPSPDSDASDDSDSDGPRSPRFTSRVDMGQPPAPPHGPPDAPAPGLAFTSILIQDEGRELPHTPSRGEETEQRRRGSEDSALAPLHALDWYLGTQASASSTASLSSASGSLVPGKGSSGSPSDTPSVSRVQRLRQRYEPSQPPAPTASSGPSGPSGQTGSGRGQPTQILVDDTPPPTSRSP